MEEEGGELKISIYSQLPTELLNELKCFAVDCERLDGYETPYHWESIQHRKNKGVNDIVCFYGNYLIGYVALYYFEPHEIEVSCLMHPEFRNEELYVLLWDYIKQNISEKYSAGILRYTFICNQKAYWIKTFLQAQQAELSNLVFKLVLLPRKEVQFDTKDALLQVQEAVPENIPDLTKIEIECFNVNPLEYKNELSNILEQPKNKILILTRGKKIIGKINIRIEEQNAFLEDFCIVLNEQGKGYGSFLLKKCISYLFHKRILQAFIEINNEAQLEWYKRFDFRQIAVMEYWKMNGVTIH